jgi:hypothetical protein
MSVWTGLAIWCIELVVVAALSASRGGARAALALATLLLLLPMFVVPIPFVLVNVLMVGVLWCAIRAADFAMDQPLQGFGARLVHLVVLVDTRLITRCQRRFDGRLIGRFVVAIAIVIVAIWLVGEARTMDGWRRYALRWFAGGFVLAPAAFTAVDAGFQLIATTVGFAIPPINDAPLLSRSVSEFWAKRWNRVVSKILHDRCYRPFAKYGTTVALFVAFAASAALHAWLIGITLGAVAATSWAVFFLAQPLLILVERRLRVRRWRPALGWLWTMSTLALLSPLFTEPLLRWTEKF